MKLDEAKRLRLQRSGQRVALAASTGGSQREGEGSERRAQEAGGALVGADHSSCAGLAS
jgi:hypothetical protein